MMLFQPASSILLITDASLFMFSRNFSFQKLTRVFGVVVRLQPE